MPARKTPAKVKPATKKVATSAAKSKGKTAKPPASKPTAKQIEKMKQEDSGFNMAQQDAVKFLQSRRQAVYNIARQYHLDPDELMQEGYEVLLTCLRDFSPVFEKSDGSWITVQFTTFFGSRMDSKGMELRNTNPEYQARQAHINEMSDGEKARFREDPPLLVQHLDQENPMQEMLRGEASMNRDDEKEDPSLKWVRDSFFDQKLSELVAREQDVKKRAILLQVKMGGVFNFQEMAYHFGVTDSRASQLLNELMDAFYVQRMIDGNVESVVYDFKKLKFNPKRVQRLVQEALTNATPQRQENLLGVFQASFPELGNVKKVVKPQALASQNAADAPRQQTPATQPAEGAAAATPSMRVQPTALKDVLTTKEKQQYPNIGVERRKLSELTLLSQDFRPPNMRDYIGAHIHQMVLEPDVYPLMITEEGLVIDGVRRLQTLQEAGEVESVSCKVFHVPDEQDAYMLRIGVNIRLMDAEKIDVYWAIVALASLGLSQQKIANTLGISRTNVIVYAKVKDKAVPALRQLYEDGLIQITNASSCVDFSEKIQERLSHFIRAYGAAWGKGSQFAELFQAAKQGKLANLEKKTASQHAVAPAPIQSHHLAEPFEKTATHQQPTNPVSANLQERLQAYENALRDAEIWTAQRESVINRQTEELSTARSEIEGLKRELEAASLFKYGDQNQMKEALKELKAFVNLTERMAAATNNTRQAVRSLRTLNPTRAQLVELQEGLDSIEQHANALRVEITNKAARKASS